MALEIFRRFQPKPKNRVALDIGAHSIKMLEISLASSPSEKPTLVSFGLKKIQGLPAEAVSASIKNLAEELKVSAKDFTISISGPSLTVRLVSMPRMALDELKSAVKYETEKLIPFDINECILDFQVLGDVAKTRGNVEILVAAVKKESVMQKVKLVENAGFGVRCVDVDSFAVSNAFLANFPHIDQAKTVAILNIGASFTNLSILRGGQLSVVRDIAIGGNDLTTAISKKTGLSFQESEELKMTPKEKVREITDWGRPVLGSLLDEVKLSFGYHENQSGRGIDEIYVSGGGSESIGLDEAFADILESKPQRWDPFKFLNTPDVDMDALGSLKNSFSVATGLALR
ncbi:MAG: pilus assembly protein PilM [Candidatus Omnitrophica bacterium]|nr:pilus assembly protein PilM [Candidatus Omnitrophota bacterium]